MSQSDVGLELWVGGGGGLYCLPPAIRTVEGGPELRPECNSTQGSPIMCF